MASSQWFFPLFRKRLFEKVSHKHHPCVFASISKTYATSTDTVPRIAQPSLWQSLVPKTIRERRSSRELEGHKQGRDWNPATFFIVIFLLIGSNAIQMIGLKSQYSSASRKADVKLGLLRDILERVGRGEEVDVEKALGTGDPKQEREWSEVMKHLEESNDLWYAAQRRQEKRRLKKEQAAAEASEEQADDGDSPGKNPTSNKFAKPLGFY